MTKKGLEQYIRKRVDYYARLLGIRHYPFEIKFLGYEDMEGIYAEVRRSNCQGEVFIDFNLDKLLNEPHEVDPTVIHELFHIVLYKLRTDFKHLVATYVGDSKTNNLLEDNYADDEHNVIFLMEKIISDGFKSKNTKNMGYSPIRTYPTSERPLPERPLKKRPRKRAKRRK